MTAEITPELSRLVRLDEIGHTTEGRHIAANEAERAALARRFGLTALDRLEANWSLAEAGKGWLAEGRITAALSQPCVATAEPVPQQIDAPFSILFLRAGDEARQGDEMELDADEVDTVLIDGDRIDMGEAIAETLALLLDPYPRSADADEYLRSMGVLSEEQAGPFAALAKLKTK